MQKLQRAIYLQNYTKDSEEFEKCNASQERLPIKLIPPIFFPIMPGTIMKCKNHNWQ
jgi:hypothetical protein